MDEDEGDGECQPRGMTGPKPITMERRRELVKLADEIAQLIERREVTVRERCVLRRAVELHLPGHN